MCWRERGVAAPWYAMTQLLHKLKWLNSMIIPPNAFFFVEDSPAPARSVLRVIEIDILKLEGNGPTCERRRRGWLLMTHSLPSEIILLKNWLTHQMLTPMPVIRYRLQRPNFPKTALEDANKQQLPISSCLWHVLYANLTKICKSFIPLPPPYPCFMPAWALSERRSLKARSQKWLMFCGNKNVFS